VPVRESEARQNQEKSPMFSRAYRTVITVPLLWVAVFLLIPYALLFCYSFGRFRCHK
jgi:hypothetical protein